MLWKHCLLHMHVQVSEVFFTQDQVTKIFLSNSVLTNDRRRSQRSIPESTMPKQEALGCTEQLEAENTYSIYFYPQCLPKQNTHQNRLGYSSYLMMG